MITLQQIAALHIEQLSGGDKSKDSTLSYQIIIKRIRHSLANFVRPLIIERYNDDDRTVPTIFVVPYLLTLANDSLGSYVDLPDYYMSLPHNRGVKRVTLRIPSDTEPGEYSDNEVIPTEFPEINRNTRAGRYPTHKKYYMQGLRMRLQSVYNEPGKPLPVLIIETVCPAPDSVSDSVPLPISPDMVSLVLKELMTTVGVVAQDKLNNEKENG